LKGFRACLCSMTRHTHLPKSHPTVKFLPSCFPYSIQQSTEHHGAPPTMVDERPREFRRACSRTREDARPPSSCNWRSGMSMRGEQNSERERGIRKAGRQEGLILKGFRACQCSMQTQIHPTKSHPPVKFLPSCFPYSTQQSRRSSALTRRRFPFAASFAAGRRLR
jgi:hypothetical protein